MAFLSVGSLRAILYLFMYYLESLIATFRTDYIRHVGYLDVAQEKKERKKKSILSPSLREIFELSALNRHRVFCNYKCRNESISFSSCFQVRDQCGGERG